MVGRPEQPNSACTRRRAADESVRAAGDAQALDSPEQDLAYARHSETNQAFGS